MAFCTKCGHTLVDGAKFCFECGANVEGSVSASEELRKQKYDGVVHKCPQCGEVIDSFTAKCPSCGHELRNIHTRSVVYDFSEKLENAVTLEEQERLIRSFYIPNTKEDLTEFIIFATTNMDANPNCEKAWYAKLEQTYQKAKLALAGSADFEYVENLYNKSIRKIRKKKITTNLKYIAPDIPRIVAILGWLVGIFVLIPSVTESENSLFLFLLLIAGMIIVPPISKGKSLIPLFIAIVGQLISIAVLISYAQDSEYSLMLFTDIVSAITILVRSFKKKSE